MSDDKKDEKKPVTPSEPTTWIGGMVRGGPYGLLEVPACRFCGGPTHARQNNGVFGPGYREWDRVCDHCGKAQ